jgi:hypothetical protein
MPAVDLDLDVHTLRSIAVISLGVSPPSRAEDYPQTAHMAADFNMGAVLRSAAHWLLPPARGKVGMGVQCSLCRTVQHVPDWDVARK